MNDIQRLERIYGAAGRELRRILSLEPGVARVRAREVVKVLNAAVDKWANDAIPRAYAKGARRTRTSLEILGRKRRHPPIEDRPRRLIDDLMVLLLRANNSIPATVDRYLSAVAMANRTVGAARVREFSFSQAEGDIGRLAAEAELKEKSRGWLSKQVKDFLRTLIEDDEFIEINGRMYRMNKYAELVARTAMRESQTAATLDMCREYENDLVVISDHGTDCEECEEFEGKTYSISGASTEYPMLEDEPPYHPNCTPGHTRIVTDRGIRPIEELIIGDRVLTHSGKYRAITHLMQRHYSGDLIMMNGLSLTPNHRVFTGRGLVPAGELSGIDQLFELSSKLARVTRIGLEANYFPSVRAQGFIAPSVGLSATGMTPSVDFQGHVSDGEVNQIDPNGMFLIKGNLIFIEQIHRLFCHLRRVFQKCLAHRLRYFTTDNRVCAGVAFSHSDQVFLKSNGPLVSYASRRVAANGTSLNSEMIKNFNMGMAGVSIHSKHHADFPHCFPRIIKVADDLSQWFIEFGLYSLESIKKILSLATGQGTGNGLFAFRPFPTYGTNVCHKTFLSFPLSISPPKMLAYSGLVFNIEVEKDHSYIAEGYLISNCKHVLLATSEEGIALEKERGESDLARQIREGQEAVEWRNVR